MHAVQTIEAGVTIGTLPEQLFKGVEATPDATAMTVPAGKHIKEHKHENSMYFTSHVHAVTINGEQHELPGTYAWVYIPEGVSHGWVDTQDTPEGKVFSYHPNHDTFDLAEAT